MSKTDTIKSVTKCPTCGSECQVKSDGTTHYYAPKDNSALSETAEEILEKHWKTVTDHPFDDMVKFHLKYCFSAMEEYAEQQVKLWNKPAVSGHVPVEVLDFLHRLRLAEHDEIRKDAIDLFNSIAANKQLKSTSLNRFLKRIDKLESEKESALKTVRMLDSKCDKLEKENQELRDENSKLKTWEMEWLSNDANIQKLFGWCSDDLRAYRETSIRIANIIKEQMRAELLEIILKP